MHHVLRRSRGQFPFWAAFMLLLSALSGCGSLMNRPTSDSDGRLSASDLRKADKKIAKSADNDPFPTAAAAGL
jgi:hypothetical protein